ncbi:hypothetical protein SAMN05216188_11851 [Lentzea xinjiangensis]|uniref:Uncharacterized protein n=1 Tax=Lentzea xinjiangensis TaxID=402600 RepID=A0A1H9TF13_9PSEU|nr:hypothetical protein [Lentzea xinjiangensis]SER95203.1 hypothetical protein SAMN05216188_11851 [Lentzea xinjiangensis]
MPLPGNVDLIEVTGTFLSYTGAAATGTVTFRPSGDPWLKNTSADVILVPGNIPCTLEDGELVGPLGAVGTGGKGVLLPATNDPDLAPNGFVYDVTIALSGQEVQAYSVALPTGTTPVDLADLAPVTPVEGSGTPIVTSVDGVSPSSTGAVVLNAKRQKAPVTLADAATINTDASLADLFRVTLGGNRTLANPSNPVDGQMLRWEIVQDGTGGRTLTPGSKFVLGTDMPSLVLTSTAGKKDILGAVYNQAADKWYVVALAKGF